MAARSTASLPDDVLELIDEKVRRGETKSRAAFIEDAVRRFASELALEELQRRHGVRGSMTPAEERRIVRKIRAMRR